MNERIQRHLDWIQAIKDAKKQSHILLIIEDIREEGYTEKRLAAIKKLQNEKITK